MPAAGWTKFGRTSKPRYNQFWNRTRIDGIKKVWYSNIGMVFARRYQSVHVLHPTDLKHGRKNHDWIPQGADPRSVRRYPQRGRRGRMGHYRRRVPGAIWLSTLARPRRDCAGLFAPAESLQ